MKASHYTLLTSLIAYTFLLSVAFAQQEKNCTFPRILSVENDFENSRDHTWRFLSPDPMYEKPHKTGQWNIHASSAYVSHGTNLNDYDSADGYDLDCIENVGKDKVLVKRMDIDGTDRFCCIHFVRRSEIVFQVKVSDYAATAETSMCEDANLKTYDTTLVHFHSASWQELLEKVPYMSCSLDGGYMIKQWTDDKGEQRCKADATNALRIEDDCDRGSGLQIIGGSENCPSPLQDFNLYKEDLMCVANWENGDYSYSVATDEWNSFFVCLRTPKQRGKEFEIDIFLDGLCDSTADNSRSTSYAKLRLLQNVVGDICADASPHCNVLGQTECTDNVPNLCRETCGVCPLDKPWLSNNLPENIQGKWLMKSSTKEAGIEVTISGRAIQYPGGITWRYFGPSPCRRQKVGHQKNAEEFILVSTSINGCLPRVASAMVNRFSESVLGLEISRSAPSELPLGKESKKTEWSTDMSSMCPKIMYLQDDMRLGDSFHTSSYGWRNLVKEDDGLRLSGCSLHPEETLDIKLDSGEQCKASMKLKTLRDAFEMTIESCKGDNKTSIPGGIQNKVRYDCMASFKDSRDWGTYVITKTKGDVASAVNETYVCWYINDQREGFLMPVSDCNDMTPSRISLDEKRPLATVRFAKIDTDDTTGSASLLGFNLAVAMLLVVLSKLAVSQL